MAGPQFFETRMGHRFYEATVPQLVKEIDALRGQLAVVANVVENHGQRINLALDRHAKAIEDNTAMMESLAVEIDRLRK